MPFSSRHTIAVVGASNNPKKFGYKIMLDLHTAGWCVIPINPKGGKIVGATAYGSLLQVPQKIDGVIFVTQPEVTEQVLFDVKQKGISDVWFQPGSDSETAHLFCQQNGINFTANACIMENKAKFH